MLITMLQNATSCLETLITFCLFLPNGFCFWFTKDFNNCIHYFVFFNLEMIFGTHNSTFRRTHHAMFPWESCASTGLVQEYGWLSELSTQLAPQLTLSFPVLLYWLLSLSFWPSSYCPALSSPVLVLLGKDFVQTSFRLGMND